MTILKERAGVISKEPVWVCLHKEYMYMSDTLLGLLIDMIKNWNSDSRLYM